jgi:hypothetical protein
MTLQPLASFSLIPPPPPIKVFAVFPFKEGVTAKREFRGTISGMKTIYEFMKSISRRFILATCIKWRIYAGTRATYAYGMPNLLNTYGILKNILEISMFKISRVP